MKTTKKDFVTFVDACKYWQNKLGLVEWSVHYCHEEAPGVYANTASDISGMVAKITLSTYWDDLREKSVVEIQRLALHEVLHLVMAPMLSEAKERYTTDYQIMSVEHSIIRRLENVIITEVTHD